MKTGIIQDLLYAKPIHELNRYVASCKESDILHVFAYNYNWNNGFDVPNTIVSNPACSLGTALMVFYLADGYRYLTERNETSDIPEWLSFISNLYNRILSGNYAEGSIAFTVPLSKVQVFKLKKQLSDAEQIFVTSIDGEDLDIQI